MTAFIYRRLSFLGVSPRLSAKPLLWRRPLLWLSPSESKAG